MESTFMKRPSNATLLSVFTKVLILLLSAKLISLVLWWYLPHESVELLIQDNYQPQYRRIDFKNMIKDSGARQKASSARSDFYGAANISSMLLKGVFGKDEKGFVVIAMRSAPKKTSMVSVGETFKGYTLRSITLNGAVFEKDGKEYVLYLKQSKPDANKYIKPINNGVKTPEGPIDVPRTAIADYIKNPKQIWDDISIVEVKEGKLIKGFKVTKINKMSKMASLGLMVNDIIIKANNIKLHSYADVLNIYKQIDKLDALQLVVMRNNQEMELTYEID